MQTDQTAVGTGPDEAPAAPPRRSRWWAIAGSLVAVVFIASVLLSGRSESVPVGASDAMPGMQMGGGRVAMSMRDASDRTVRLPGEGPTVAVFAQARRCAACAAAVRSAGAALGAVSRAQLIVVMIDSATTRDDVADFARSVGRSPARYVVDDRGGALASMLGAPVLGGAIVFDSRGVAVAEPAPTVPAIGAALRRADR